MNPKKEALNNYKNLKKLLKTAPTDFNSLYEHLKTYPLFSRYIYSSDVRGFLEFHYADMTLKISLKNGIIELSNEIKLWKHDEPGFLGEYTEKSLNLELSGDLD